MSEEIKEDILFHLMAKISIHMSKLNDTLSKIYLASFPEEERKEIKGVFNNFIIQTQAEKCTDEIFLYLKETLGIDRYVVPKKKE